MKKACRFSAITVHLLVIMRIAFYITLIFLACLRPCRSSAQDTDIMNLEQFQQRVIQDNDTLYVVNFWATWCTPCVRELPHFKALYKKFEGRPVRFILMSLDARDNLDGVRRFLEKKGIAIESHLFSAGDPNIWINTLEPSWEGSIPATFLYQHGSKLSFKETYFASQKELELFILNHN